MRISDWSSDVCSSDLRRRWRRLELRTQPRARYVVPSRKERAMSATKILWGQILTVFLIILMTTWAATQWTAYRLGFQPQLGLPWFELAGWPIYYPPAFFWWRSEEQTSEIQ